MKGKRYTEEQIIGILKEHEAGMPARTVSCRPSICDTSTPRSSRYFFNARGLD